ncbi:MAG: hypothetical protein SGBAC_005252 [Bacillariaceae sp.]
MTTIPKNNNNLPNEDIRAKYARKLQGGIAGIELAKNQVENALAKGDAPGHLVARKMAMGRSSSSSSTTTTTKGAGEKSSNWMAMSGTGVLLSYLSHRSIQLALLPNIPTGVNENENDGNDSKHQLQSMESLKRQLKDVVIDCIVDPAKLQPQQQQKQKQSSKSSEHPNHHILLKEQLLNGLSDNIHPNAILVVSHKDPYLKAAKELGMLTCRLQPPNARRGNVSAHFNIPAMDQVQEVVNEINGISFNAILNNR